MALKTKKAAMDFSATVRDILNTGKEDGEKVAEEVKKETEKVKMATAKAAAETKAKTAEKMEEATKKTAAKKTSATKSTVKKATSVVKKATAAVKEAAEAKASTPKVTIQYSGNDYSLEDILANAKKAYSKKSKKVFKDLRVYIKPEEGKVYYVADDNVGSIDL